jgi:soluble lytic murein transglycosylase
MGKAMTTRSASRSRGASRPTPRGAAQGRAGGRRAAAKATRATRPNRLVALLGAVAIGVGGWYALTEFDLGDKLREVTLPLRHDDIIRQQAADKNLDPALIAAVIYSESRFRDQTSHAGARGLMQITPATARIIEDESGGTTFVLEDLADPDINIAYGSFHLRHLLRKYEGNEVAALAAYNAGEARADEWGGAALELEDIQFEETRGYVEEVLGKREEYREHYARDLGLE